MLLTTLNKVSCSRLFGDVFFTHTHTFTMRTHACTHMHVHTHTCTHTRVNTWFIKKTPILSPAGNVRPACFQEVSTLLSLCRFSSESATQQWQLLLLFLRRVSLPRVTRLQTMSQTLDEASGFLFPHMPKFRDIQTLPKTKIS